MSVFGSECSDSVYIYGPCGTKVLLQVQKVFAGSMNCIIRQRQGI